MPFIRTVARSSLTALGSLLTTLAFTSATSISATPMSSWDVPVRFGSLHWLDAESGPPRLREGRVWVPWLPACDLLDLNCRREGDGVRVNGARIRASAGFVELRSLVRTAPNFTLTYDVVARQAVVGTLPNVDMIATPWMQAQNDWGVSLRPPYLGPLSVRRAEGGRYTVRTRGVRLRGLTFLSGLPAGRGANVRSLDVRGALTPSLPDTPNRDPGCGDRVTCTGTASTRALWVLAAVEGGPVKRE